MRLPCSIPLSFTFSALLCGTALLAQHSTAAPRITAEVDESSLTTLHGNVPRMARAEFDQGEAEPGTELSHIRLVLSRSPAQQAALNAYLAELQSPASPNYHKWLTPAEFGAEYGPADADVATLVAWLQSHGLAVEPVPAGRTDIAFSGTVSQVEAALHTSIHSYLEDETQFYSNTTDPQIPSALTAVVQGVAHLNTIRPQPQLIRGGAGRFNAETRQMEPAGAGASAEATPGLTTGSSSAGYSLYMVPADAATIYNTPNSFNANNSGMSYTGTGVKIGIGGAATISGSIVANYRSMFLGSATRPTIYYCTGSTFSSCSATPASPVCSGTSTSGCYNNADDADEAYLDNELAGGLAPGASIYYYASTDLISGIEAAIQENTVDIFSLSFGQCEQDMSTSDNQQINAMWQQAATQGIAVTVSAGDSGSAGCDATTTSKGANVPQATGGLAVSGFASTPYNIAVGGTDFYALRNSFSSYVSTTNGTDYGSALGYIPESTWNDSSYNDTALSDNVPLSDAGQGYSASDNNIVSGSGGHSSCSTNTTVDTNSTAGSCTHGYSKPSWQTGTGQWDSDGVRDIPDVSLMAGNGKDNATWLVCTDDTATINGSTETENCATQANGYFYFAGFGGTSTAAPAFAGILALVEQSQMQTTGCAGAACRMGQAAQTLYELYNGSHASAIFHDVTVGNNSVPCASGTPNCAADSLGYYFEGGYDTGTGYDLATGMGSVDATQLVNQWSTAASSSGAFTLTASSPASVAAGASATSTVTVSSSNSYAGSVTLSCALTSYPSGASYLPTCSGGSSAVMLSSSITSGTATVTVNTTAASSELAYPRLPAKGRGLLGAGGAVLAFLVFLGVPARRRGWRSMLGALVVMAALGSISGCSSATSGGSTGTSGTTAGVYTFTVTGTGSPAISPAPSATFTLTVQ